jgi:hypothetical protein
MAKQMELLGWAWFTKNHKALVLGMRDADGTINEKNQMIIFTDDLAKIGQADHRSAKIYRSEPLPPR